MESQRPGRIARFGHRLRDQARRWSPNRRQAVQEAEAETQADVPAPVSTSTIQQNTISQETANAVISQNQITESAQLDPSGSTHLDAAAFSAILGPSASALSQSTPQDKSSALWKEAYDSLRSENTLLLEHYEALLKEQAGVSQSTNFEDQLATVANIQLKKAANKQWTFQWLGEQQRVRDIAEGILGLANRVSSLVAIGTSYAPPYVSIPWSAITAIIPLMMNDIKEHKGCIEGLETVARLTFSYQMAESAFLAQDETAALFTKSVMDLYKKILHYQALAIEYFGKSTLRRLGKNVLGSTEWAAMPAAIADLDKTTRGSLYFLGQQYQIAKLITIHEVLNQQERSINNLIQSFTTERDKVAQVAEWVSSISAEHDHKNVRQKLGKAHFSSGQWFLDEIHAWRTWEKGNQCLWLRGGVGAGKSSLMSILIEDLMKSPDGVTAFFYCSKTAAKDGEKSTWRNSNENILRSLLAQVSVSVDGTDVHDCVSKRYNRDPRRVLAGLSLSSEECVQLLEDVFSDVNAHFTIVIDALDECTDYDELLRSLKDVVQFKENVRFACSSRFEVNLQNYFPEATTVTILTQNHPDIQDFLEIEIFRRQEGSGMTIDQANRLKKAIMSNASGIFMWAKLQVNLLLHEIKSQRIRLKDDIETKLKLVEATRDTGENLLDAAYQDVYNTAIGGTSQERRKEIVTSALRWVLCSFRALTLRELAYATTIRSDGTVASDIQEGMILEFCSNLLIEDSIGIIRLPHLSVRQFLEKQDQSLFFNKSAHQQAALTCLYFVNSPSYCIGGPIEGNTFHHKAITATERFHTYITSYWARHCMGALKSEEVDRLINIFAGKLQKLQTQSFIERIHGNTSEESTRSSVQDDAAKDNVASTEATSRIPTPHKVFEDFIEYIRGSKNLGYELISHYIACGSDLGTQDQSGNTLLHEAVRFRQLGVLKALSAAGAPLNSQNNHGNTPMHLASMHHFNQGIQQLLLAGADKDVRNKKGETPLHLAAMFEAQPIFETLISANADTLAKDHQGNTPQDYSFAVGNETSLKSFLPTDHNPILSSQNNTRGSDLDYEVTKNISLVDCADKDNVVSYCDYCDVARWMAGSKRRASYKHWPSIGELSTSAANGCPLCEFFTKELKERCRPEVLYAAGELVVKIGPHFMQGSEIDRKDKLVLYAGSSALLTYELCTDQDGPLPALGWLTGRTVSKVPNTPANLDMIRNWVNTCHSKSHPRCIQNDDSLPPRVLDVSGTKVYLISSNEMQASQYIYAVNRYHQKDQKEITFNCEEFYEHKIGILPDTLPDFIRDAIHLTRLLGFKYLWTMELCDTLYTSWEHKSGEFDEMGTYMRNSHFVIVAAFSKAGITYARQQPLFRMKFMQYTDINSANNKKHVSVYLRRPLETAAEALRVYLRHDWALNDVILPHRLLILGKHQMYWHCHTCLMSEGSVMVQKPLFELLPRLTEHTNSSISENGRTFFPWYNFIHIYSRAIGLANYPRAWNIEPMAQYFGGTLEHRQGLWVEDLHNGLLWRVNDVSIKNTLNDWAPTWSWASRMNEIVYDALGSNQHERVSQDKEFSVLQVVCKNKYFCGLDPPDHYLNLEAMTLEISIGLEQGGFYLFFDDIELEQEWRKSIPFLLVSVCPWNPIRGTDLGHARGLGLVLCDATIRKDRRHCTNYFIRVGLFYMLNYDEALVGWSRRTLKLI